MPLHESVPPPLSVCACNMVTVLIKDDLTLHVSYCRCVCTEVTLPSSIVSSSGRMDPLLSPAPPTAQSGSGMCALPNVCSPSGIKDMPCSIFHAMIDVTMPFDSPGLSAMSTSREMAVQSLHLMPNHPDHVVVCVKGPQAFIMTTQGQVGLLLVS